MSDEHRPGDRAPRHAPRSGEIPRVTTGEMPVAEKADAGRRRGVFARVKIPPRLFGGKVRTTTLALCVLWIGLYLLNGHFNPSEEGSVQGPQPVSDVAPPPATTTTVPPPATTEPTTTETYPTTTTTTGPSPSTSSGIRIPGSGEGGDVTTTTTTRGGLIPPFFLPQQEATTDESGGTEGTNGSGGAVSESPTQ
ncbi:hypothetical protein [Rhodococcus sp. HNM0569]|uniref:hypothetical protein n=1 Tax=Rhodococcus sp. HNM0569 TaxID=2716340 RepID=UPI00146A30D9|nr:hypothetical protein [Rhodococcus sp. HNM0569]NLU81994.1 hypothetical protein [Rhodococcus sp. HNM0569]